METSVEGTVSTSLALAEPVCRLVSVHFPTISEFNAEIQRETYLLRPSVQVHLRTDHPNVNTTQICLPSSLINLKKDDIMPSIILSTDKLFFVRSKTNDTYEWILVQLNLNLSIQKDPSCVKNHRFLFDHYHCHPKDIKYPHTNRRYWKEYHKILGKSQIHDKIHLIKPTENERTYCKENFLAPFRSWINITDDQIYLHGPFDFAKINHRSTKDRISTADWKILQSLSSKYSNQPPIVTTQTSFHIDTPVNLIYSDPSVQQKVANHNLHAHFND